MRRLLLKRKVTQKRAPAWQHGGSSRPRRKNNRKKTQKMKHDEEEYRSASDEDYSDTANERPSEYRKGGYHAVTLGEVYKSRYRIVHKLGWGYFSTVWLVWDYDTETFKAMKVQKAASHYRDAALDEIKLLSDIMQKDPDGKCCCARMNDYFEHRGPNGLHVCMIFDVLGENILKLIERYEYRGIPLPIVKNIMKQVLQGLAYIHSLNIIHTDLKPENVLFSTPPHKIQRILRNYAPPDRHKGVSLLERDPKSMTKSQKKRFKKKIKSQQKQDKSGSCADAPPGVVESNSEDETTVPRKDLKEAEIEVQDESETDPEQEIERIQHVTLADFGNGCWTHKQFTDEIQTRQYRSPEVILGMGYDCSADLWSAACMCFELITGEFLFDPKQGENYDRDEDHLALMIEALGPLPVNMATGNGKFRHKFLTLRGELRHIHELRYWPLERVLHEKYRFTKRKAHEISEFLLPMLRYNPEERYTAVEMLQEFESTFFTITESDYPAYCYAQEGESFDAATHAQETRGGSRKEGAKFDLEIYSQENGIPMSDIEAFLRGDFDQVQPENFSTLKNHLTPALSAWNEGNFCADEEEEDWDGDDELDELLGQGRIVTHAAPTSHTARTRSV